MPLIKLMVVLDAKLEEEKKKKEDVKKVTKKKKGKTLLKSISKGNKAHKKGTVLTHTINKISQTPNAVLIQHAKSHTQSKTRLKQTSRKRRSYDNDEETKDEDDDDNAEIDEGSSEDTSSGLSSGSSETDSAVQLASKNVKVSTGLKNNKRPSSKNGSKLKSGKGKKEQNVVRKQHKV